MYEKNYYLCKLIVCMCRSVICLDNYLILRRLGVISDLPVGVCGGENVTFCAEKGV